MKDKPFVVRGVELRTARGRGLYLTEDCKKTGLPLLTPDLLQTRTWRQLQLPWERRNNGHPIRTGEEPVAFKVTGHGASPLYLDGRMPPLPPQLPEPEDPCLNCPKSKTCRFRFDCSTYRAYIRKREDVREGRVVIRQRHIDDKAGLSYTEDELRKIAEKVPWRKEDTSCEEK